MTRLIVLLLVAAHAWAQSSTVVTLLPITNPSTGTPSSTGYVRFRDLSSGYVDLKSPTTVTSPYSIVLPDTAASGCTSPAVSGGVVTLTFGTCLWSNGTNIQSSQVQIWGGGVPRVLLWNGGAFGAGGLRLFNTAGDRYWTIKAATGTTGTSTDWVWPTEDGSAGDALVTDGAGNLSFSTIAGGGSSPPFVDSTNIIKGSADATKLLRVEVDGLTTGTTRTWTAPDASLTVAGIDLAQTWTATQTMRDVNPSATDTYKLGDTARWYQVAANRLDGICSGCTTSTNYARTRKMEVYDQTGGGAFWYQYANVPVAGTASAYYLVDNAGTQVATFQTSDISGTSRKFYWKGDIVPGTTAAAEDNTWDIGASANKYKKAWMYEIETSTLATPSTGTLTFSVGQVNTTATTNFVWPSGSNVQSSQVQLFGGGVARLLASNGGAGGSGLLRVLNTAGDRYWGLKASTATTGTSTDWVLPTADGSIGQCMKTDGSANLGWSDCGSAPPYADTTNLISGSSDATKLLRFEVDGFTTGATRTLTPQNASYTIAGTNITNTFSSSQTFSSGIDMAASTLSWTTGSNVQSSQLQLFGGGVVRTLTSNGGALGSGLYRAYNTAGDRYWGLKAATSTTGTSTDWVLPTVDGSSDQCLKTDGSANLGWKTCGSGTGTVTSIATSGPISGGTITTTGTISCPTCVTSVTGSGPISSTGGTTPAISCSTCVTTSGTGQTLSGDFTVTGNWYARSFSGSGISCSGVADGWMGWDYTNQYLIMCAGGARYRVNLAAY